jgi:alpha-1,3-rhamnosyl/mannosyltransferase
VREQVEIPLRLLGHRLDLVHAPHYVTPFAVPHPLVVTVHDVIHLLFPEFLTPVRRRIAGTLLALALRRARRVIAPSGRTADDIARLFPVARRKLRVIPAGLSALCSAGPPAAESVEAWRAARALPHRYLLAVGAIRPHKNLLLLARAYAASGLAPEVGLVLAGEVPARFRGLLAEIAAAGGDGVRFIGRVADADLPPLYAGATAVAVPSLYEGFGSTAVEAMAMGVPVLAAAAGSLPEVVGEAGLLIPPEDLPGWSAALGRIGRAPALRAELGARGRERVRALSLERLGAETVAVYREAALA